MSTLVTLEEAAGIMGKTSDEVMYLVQNKKIQAGVNPDTLAWSFELSELIKLKQALLEETSVQFLTE
jgi:hypothetical protein